MSSKFSDQVAQGMSEILKNESFYKPFKATIKTASDEGVFNITDLESRYPDAYNALLDSDKAKLQYYTFYVNSAGKVCAKEPGGTDEYLFTHSPNHAPTWVKIAESDEQAFEIYAAKKKDKDEDKDDEKSDKKDKKDKKEKSDKDEKDEKKDKKSKKDDKDDEDEEEDDKKSKKKKSKKDDEDDKNDAKALIFAAKKDKEEKKDGKDKSEKADDKDDKKDKPKGKKKQFPFWLKKKKAGENHEEECDCNECMEANDGMFASAIRHIVETFSKTSAALDNMGLEKSSIATMAILNHIIEEAANVKFAKTTPLEEKLNKLKDQFKKMHEKDEEYDADVAEELDKKITEIETQLKKEKKEDKEDSNDVRGTDLLLGLDDPEAQEGFLDHNLDDPHSSAALEEIFSKNPSLVDEIAPRLKSQFGDKAIEDQLKERIKSRLPSVIETPENSDISEILKAYNKPYPKDANIPSEEKETLIPGSDPLKTKIDELNADDHKKLPSHEHGKPVIYLTDKDKVLCADCATEAKEDGKKVKPHLNEEGPDHHCEECGEKLESEYGDSDDNDSDDMVQAFNLVNEWIKEGQEASSFEDDGDNTTVSQDDLKSILDVIGGYSQKEIADREKAMKPSELDLFATKYFKLTADDKSSLLLDTDGWYNLQQISDPASAAHINFFADHVPGIKSFFETLPEFLKQPDVRFTQMGSENNPYALIARTGNGKIYELSESKNIWEARK
jgi:hypothetical protein